MIIEIIVTVLTIFIIYRSYKRYNKFTIRPTVLSVKKPFNLEEIFTYPDCNGCLSVTNQIKPFFKYNISDSRCVKNTTPSFINKNILDDIISYNSDYSALSGLTGCVLDYNSIYSSVLGRYVVIVSDNIIETSEISVYSKYKSKLNTASTYTYNNGKKIIIDLMDVYDIGYIYIKHNTVEAASTLNNANVYVFGIDVIDVDTRNKLFSYKIPSTSLLEKTIYTQAFIRKNDSSTGYVTDSIIWGISGCTGCVHNDRLFMNFKYNVEDGRCFRPKDYTITKSNLIDVIDYKNLNTMNNYFTSCSNETDTRFVSPIGRFIIIKKTGASQTISLKNIVVYGESSNIIQPITAHTHPVVNSFYGENLLDGNNSTITKASGIDPYILIDLGVDKIITKIILHPNVDDEILGSILSIVASNYTVLSVNTVTSYDIPIYRNNFDKVLIILKLPLISETSAVIKTGDIVFKNTDPLLFGEPAACGTMGSISATFTDIPSTSEYTIQGWFKLNKTSGVNVLFNFLPFQLQIVDGIFQFIINGILNTLVNASVDTDWTFFVITRNNLSVTYLYKGSITNPNLIQMYSTTNNSTIGPGNVTLFNNNDKTARFDGCIRDFKIVKGQFYNSTKVPTESIGLIKTFETYDYPVCMTGTDCITKQKSTKPRLRYKLSNNRCVIGKDNVDCIGCLDNINNYLYDFDQVNQSVDSCHSEYNTRFNKIIGRYIKLTRVSTKNALSIKNIKILDPYNNSVIDDTTTAFVRPLKNNLYGNLAIDGNVNTIMTTGIDPLDSTNPNNIFILIDLNQDKEIMYLEIEPGDNALLTDLRLIIANSNLNIVYQKNLH